MVQGYTQQDCRSKSGWVSNLGSGRAEAGKPFSGTIFYSRDIQLIPTLYFLKTAKYQIVLRGK